MLTGPADPLLPPLVLPRVKFGPSAKSLVVGRQICPNHGFSALYMFFVFVFFTGLVTVLPFVISDLRSRGVLPSCLFIECFVFVCLFLGFLAYQLMVLFSVLGLHTLVSQFHELSYFHGLLLLCWFYSGCRLILFIAPEHTDLCVPAIRFSFAWPRFLGLELCKTALCLLQMVPETYSS